jgi:hypothetical protein
MDNRDTDPGKRMDRREAIKWMMTAAATGALLERGALGATATNAATAGSRPGAGYGTDPDLLKTYRPGEVWPLTFNDAQRATAAALCDAIIPADEKGPGAKAVRVHEFIDEWISAPYPGHDDDKRLVIEGLGWIEAESRKRFQNGFVNLVTRQRNALCDDICFPPQAKPEFRQAARFFSRYRDLTAGGYYSTPEGMKDIGYTGNVPMEKFAVPAEVLRKLGLA